jgi:hypothetical protein
VTWVYVGALNPKADMYRYHSEATVHGSDAGYPIGYCPCCSMSWRKDLMVFPDDRAGIRKLKTRPIPTFVPVELAGAWTGYA